MSANEFIENVLIEVLGVRHVVVGKGFCFGKGRSGNLDLLRKQGQRHRFSVEEMDIVTVAGERVSSTRTRKVLMHGDFDLAERLLGRRFHICGRIIGGDGRGKEIGFATANIAYGRNTPPLQGVFASEVDIAGKSYPAVANAGIRPTVDGEKYQLEAHIFDFSDQIYGQKITLEPLLKIRDEKHFGSIDELKHAIASDVKTAKEFFTSKGRI